MSANNLQDSRSGSMAELFDKAYRHPDALGIPFRRPENPSRRRNREARAGGMVFPAVGRGAGKLTWARRASVF